MNVLKLYYAHILRLNEIFPFLNEKRNEDNVLKKLCRTVLVCCHSTNEKSLRTMQDFLHQNAPASKFVSILSKIRDPSLAKFGIKDYDKIFRLTKLNSSLWKNLHMHLGDDLFEKLLTKFDIFYTLSSSTFTQIVGIPLSDRRNPIVSVKRKINDDKNGFLPDLKRRKLNSDVVSVRKFLYSKDLRESTKKGHFKFCTKVDCSNVDLMVKDIFGVGFVGKINEIFLDLIHRYHRNCFRGLLDYHCPMIDNIRNAPLSELVRCFVRQANVRNYFRTLFTQVIPQNLLGVKNSNYFNDMMTSRIVNFRRFDVDNLRSFTDSFKMKNCPWIHKLPVDNKTKHQILLSLYRWLLRYVVHLVKKSFYATESQFLKHRILFYRKPIWAEIRRKASLEFVNKCNLEKISRSHCRNKKEQFGPFGFRFIPKYSSVRPILANCDNDHHVEKMNKNIKPTHAVLQYILSVNNDLLGSTKADFESIRTAWKQFINRQRFTSTKILKKPLYFVKADVNSCFDSMIHSVLLEILEQDLKPRIEEYYAVQAYCCISMKNDRMFRSYRHSAWPSGHGSDRIDKNIFKLSKGRKMIIVVKHDRPKIVSSEDILNSLKMLINNHIVKMLRKFYLQKQGIAQGSAVSVTLCNLYLAKLERRHFDGFMSAEEDLLMRHVDDFLFVTPNKQKAVDFVRLLLNGLHDFNIVSSPEKVVTNFDGDRLNSWFLITDGNERGVPWCGLLFHPMSGEVSTDDSRWLILDTRDLMTVNFCVNSNEYLKTKLIKYLISRSHAICYDDEVNSFEKIKENILSLFQFLARCCHEFKTTFGSARCRIRNEEISSIIARKMVAIISKESPNMQHNFSINKLAKWFEALLKC